MATRARPDSDALSPIEYHEAEGFPEVPATLDEPEGPGWTQVAVGLVGLVALLAAVIAGFALARTASDATPTVVQKAAAAPAATPHAPTLAESKGIAFEEFERVDPTLPAVPAGAVKKFRVDVLQHVTQVDPQLAPTEAWTYAVNGKAYRGTAASPPIVVNEGDKVEVTFVNGGSKEMAVNMPHSIDFHSAEVAPNKNYIDIAPGDEIKIEFVADHPGVFMYHCATQPILLHTSAGMMGMMVVKPRDLAPVDRELWLTQEEFYLGQPGKPADMAKMAAATPDVLAFNGFANQYKAEPIAVRRGERIRMYLLDAGPSKWSAFHVIGTVFDRTVIEGTVGHNVQTVSLAPSQGGWVEFTLDEEGNYPFLTHSFGDMVKGAAGVLHTAGAPAVAAEGHGGAHEAAMKGDVQATLGDMWVKASTTSVKAGKVTFDVTNSGATSHGLAIVPAPAKVSGGMLDESAFAAKGEPLAGGATGTLTADLKPGRYELVCFIPGHYMAGQKLPFEVQ
ncbi:MAG TPA: multicopper oxidase domain-containing protein [Solirubrobacter sp.]|nr:multicopper oxidase domain-containing protein [Solirubrobacter sp.]